MPPGASAQRRMSPVAPRGDSHVPVIRTQLLRSRDAATWREAFVGWLDQSVTAVDVDRQCGTSPLTRGSVNTRAA